MCGIAGWVGRRAIPASEMQAVGEVFAQGLQHRGPDGFGISVFVDTNDSAMLMHRRLSILGLGEAGNQPMRCKYGRFHITFNGEIYNYIELAEKYQLENVSGTDTEILLALWAQLGPDVLKELDGFFAFAVWDDQLKTLTMVRDKTGVKPLYYYRINETEWMFSSEEFALVQSLKAVGVSVSLNERALLKHIEYGDSDSDYLYQEIFSLHAGTMMVVGGDAELQLGGGWGVNSNRRQYVPWYTDDYIRLDDTAAWESLLGFKQPLEHYSDLLRAQLRFGMKRRLRSDVPLGFAVSGGVDSAALVGLARDLLGKEAHIHAFSVVSPGCESDESTYQQAVVEAVGGIWHKIDVADIGFDDLERYIRATHRIPVAWNNIAHFKLCEKVQAAGVKVLFNGQGADELFGGYPHYYKAAFWHERGRLWAVRDRWPIGFFDAGKQWVKYRLGVLKGQKYEDCVDRLMWADYYGPRLNQLLRFEDRNGMACGLESRNPFADDSRLADAWLNAWSDDTWSLEGSLSSKLVNGYSKGYLRKAMQGLVPESVLWRTDKKGFTVPAGGLTMKFLNEIEKWVLSPSLDGIVERGQRQKALARAQQFNKIQKKKSVKSPSAGSAAASFTQSDELCIKFTGKQEAQLAQLFRWAALGCFLELFHPQSTTP